MYPLYLYAYADEPQASAPKSEPKGLEMDMEGQSYDGKDISGDLDW